MGRFFGHMRDSLGDFAAGVGNGFSLGFGGDLVQNHSHQIAYGLGTLAGIGGLVGGGDVLIFGRFALKEVAQGAARRLVARGVAKGLPKNADDLLKQGYKETSHPDAVKAGHRVFENVRTGDKLRFDQGKSEKPGYEGQDHYHRYNPDATGKHNQYLNKDGNPCARGCDASHLFPGD